MITFDLTYTYSPDAIGGYLEYRNINPDGSFSSWVVAGNSIGNITGYITPLTGSLTNVQGNIFNPIDFSYNTSYQFRIRQICPGDVEEISDVDGDYYALLCPSYAVQIGVYDVTTSSYPIEVVLNHLDGRSITNYIITISDTPGGPPLHSQNFAVDIVSASFPYIVTFDNSNVPGGISYGIPYYITVNVTVITSTQVLVTSCSENSITPPTCSMYKIVTGDRWQIHWVDCDGVTWQCGSVSPHLPIISGGVGTAFNICASEFPKAYYCAVGGILQAPVIAGNGLPINGATVTLLGPCDPSQYSYNISNIPPLLDFQPCEPCI